MQTVPISDYFSDVAIHVTGCPHPVMEHAVRSALIEFCSDTLVWQETQDAESVTASSFPYEIEPPANAMVVKLMHVLVDGVALEPTSEDILNQTSDTWRTTLGTPSAYVLTGATELRLSPQPDVASSMQLVVACAPSRTATVAPAFIHRMWAEGIAAGALARLFAMPNKAWSNPGTVALAAQVFGNAKSSARVSANLSFTRSALRVQMRPF